MDIGLTFPSFFRIAMEGRGRLGHSADGMADVKPQAAGQANPSGTRPRAHAARNRKEACSGRCHAAKKIS